jgi:hypothetical protein
VEGRVRSDKVGEEEDEEEEGSEEAIAREVGEGTE